MSDLEKIKGFIARGDKETAVAQLASLLMEDRHDVEAWLLLGETIDDPSKKKDCYHWVLRLSPDNVLALAALQELEPPASDLQTTSANDAQRDTKESLNTSRQNSNYIPNQYAFPSVNQSKDEPEVISFFVVGILGALVILYVVVTGNFSGYRNAFCWGLIFLAISAVMIVSFVINKNRG
jgi:hypothetical protein